MRSNDFGPFVDLKTQIKPVRHWRWKNEVGKDHAVAAAGNRVMEIAAGNNSIEVGSIADLPKVLTTLREAIVAGEVDDQLKKPPNAKPIVTRKTKSPLPKSPQCGSISTGWQV